MFLNLWNLLEMHHPILDLHVISYLDSRHEAWLNTARLQAISPETKPQMIILQTRYVEPYLPSRNYITDLFPWHIEISFQLFCFVILKKYVFKLKVINRDAFQFPSGGAPPAVWPQFAFFKQRIVRFTSARSYSTFLAARDRWGTLGEWINDSRQRREYSTTIRSLLTNHKAGNFHVRPSQNSSCVQICVYTERERRDQRKHVRCPITRTGKHIYQRRK